MSWPKQPNYSLYLVTDAALVGKRDFLACLQEALRSGVTMVQLREKTLSTREFYNLAHALQELTQAHGVPLIINDRLDLALAVDADGVHLGQDDLPAAVARRLLGQGKLLGISAATLAEALQAAEQGADYVGVGAVFPTETKLNVRKVTLSELATIKSKLSVPVLAIGGITAQNAAQVMATGVDGICVAKAILSEDDILAATARLKQLVTHKGESK